MPLTSKSQCDSQHEISILALSPGLWIHPATSWKYCCISLDSYSRVFFHCSFILCQCFQLSLYNICSLSLLSILDSFPENASFWYFQKHQNQNFHENHIFCPNANFSVKLQNKFIFNDQSCKVEQNMITLLFRFTSREYQLVILSKNWKSMVAQQNCKIFKIFTCKFNVSISSGLNNFQHFWA